jgi:hypothetical protein
VERIVKKKILMIANANHVEAMRVATGLTLLSDEVSLHVLGNPEDSPEIREQMEVLEFADIPVTRLPGLLPNMANVARDLVASHVVYVI